MYNQEAEIDLVGCIILDPLKAELAPGLMREDFSDIKRWEIYEAVQAAVNDGDPDSSKIAQKLKEGGCSATWNDMNWHMENSFSISKPGYLAGQIKASTAKRQTMGLFDVAKKNIKEDYKTFFDIFETGLSEIKNRLNFGKGFVPVGKALVNYFNEMEGRWNGTIIPKLVYTGFSDVDRIVGGFRAGNLCIIAGRTSMGKSAAMLNIATNASRKGRVVIFSLEMDEAEISERMLSAATNIDSLIMRDRPKDLTKKDFGKLADALSDIGNRNKIIIDDTPGISVLDVRSKARQLHAESPLECVIVDHIGLMSGGMRFESKRVETSFISGKLKSLAKELGIPVIALAQLNRGEDGSRPKMSSLKESGSLEEDANQVILLHREDYYCEQCRANEKCDKNHLGTAEWIIDKNRGGPTGLVKMIFFKQFTRFEQINKYQD